MASSIRRVIEIDVTAAKALRDLDSIDRSTASAERSLKRLQSQASMVGSAFIGMIGLNSLGGLSQLADTAIDVEARLNAVAGSTVGIDKAWSDLLEVGNRLGVGIDELASSYTKLGVAVPEASHEKLVKSLDTMGTVLATTGASAQQVNAVMLQMSQALGSGALQGDEFRAVFENAPVLLRAWQEAAGLTGHSLRDLSSSASLTTESFLENIDAISALAKEMVGLEKPPQTIARAFVRLRNEFITFMRDSESLKAVFTTIAGAINVLADNLDAIAGTLGVLAFGYLIKQLNSLRIGLVATTAAAGSFSKAMLASKGNVAILTAAASYLVGVKLREWFEDSTKGARGLADATETYAAYLERAGNIGTMAFDIEETDTLERLQEKLEYLIRTVKRAIEEQERHASTLRKNNPAYIALTRKIEENRETLRGLRTDLLNVNDALDDTTSKLSSLPEYVKKANAGIAASTEEAAESQRRLIVLQTQGLEVYEKYTAARKAEAAALKETGVKVGDSTTERELRAVRELSQAKLASADSSAALENAVKKEQDALREAAAAQEKASRAQRDSRTDTQKYIDTVASVLNMNPRVKQSFTDILPIIDKVSQRYNINREMLIALINQESRFSKTVVNMDSKARGFMQIVPATATMLAKQLGISVNELFDSSANQLEAGTKYLRFIIDKFDGDVRKALAGYNWGPYRKTLEKGLSESLYPAETKNYIAKITENTEKMRKALGETSFELEAQESKWDAWGEKVKAASGTYASLVQEADPVAAAMAEAEETAAKLSVELASGGINAEQFAEGMSLLKKKVEDAKDDIKGLSIEIKTMGEITAETISDMVSGIEGDLSTAFENLFNGSSTGAQDFIKDIRSTFQSGLASMASSVVMNPFKETIKDAFTITKSDGSSGSGGTGGLFSGVTSLFTGKQFGETIGEAAGTIISKIGFSEVGDKIQAGLSQISNWVYGASITAGTAIGTYAFEEEGNYAGVGATVGSSIGAAAGAAVVAGTGLTASATAAYGATVGSVVPVIGTAIGAVVGALAGAYLGSLFGAAEKETTMAVGYSVEDGFKLLGYKSGITAETAAEIETAFDEMTTNLNDLAELLDVEDALVGINWEGILNAENLEEGIEQWYEDLTKYVIQTYASRQGGELEDLINSTYDNLGLEGLEQLFTDLESLAQAINLIDDKSVNSLEEAAVLYNVIGEGQTAVVENLVTLANYIDELQGSFVNSEAVFATISDVFQSLSDDNIGVPASADALRAFIESLDMTTRWGVMAASAVGSVAGELQAYYEFVDSITEYGEDLVDLAAVLDSNSTGGWDDYISIIKELGETTVDDAIDSITSLSSLFSGMASEAHKTAVASGRVGAVFEDLGDEMPKSLESLYAYVQGLDLTTEDGIRAAAALGDIAEELEHLYTTADGGARSLQTYVDALLSIQDTLDATRSTIGDFGKSEQELYNIRKARADQLMDALGEMTDAGQIQETVGQINTLIGEGWGYLTDNQKRVMKDQFLSYLNEVEQIAEERLGVGAAQYMEDGDVSFEGSLRDFANIMNSLDGSLAGSSEGFEASSAEMREAAASMLAAASEMRQAANSMPGTINVRVTGSEVD